MKIISRMAFIAIVTISPLTAMQEGQESVEIPYKAVQSKKNYLKTSDGTYLTCLPEQTSTALQDNNARARAFVTAINNEIKKTKK